ncbi:asparagine synthase (glutamine-hydrolyzing) [Chitinivorax sp. PXF-14]|uniref:asparagine synthase (glutamine-hydrolyzing) n=1 Tax=Chitinivorax sp. PXF-14 TaxID=3230488 RepID=UPI0034677599
MCGFAGFIESGGLQRGAETRLRQMASAIHHRGPDDEGIWLDPQSGIALAHRRLSIVDLSPTGHQPMASASGRWIIAFNGEIYNHASLRTKLEASGWCAGWRGHSDTEVLLAAISAWGLRSALDHCVGMFAFALWDRETETLTLGRDRIGEKPLYYGWLKNTFVFSSDLACFYDHPNWQGHINRDALALLMRHNYIPAPYSVFDGISKLRPAHLLILDKNGYQKSIESYWDAKKVAQEGQEHPFKGSPEDSVNELESLIKQSLAGQMMADVPLGAFLSGGIDSSTVVAIMQSMSSSPIQTFSIGFNEEGYDEAKHAKAVATHLGTKHTELYVSPKEAINVIPRLPEIYSEPFSDSSQIPTFLVSQLAKRSVTVALSGDGGDELFSGYTRYALSGELWKKISSIPQPLRTASASLITSISPGAWNSLFSLPLRVAPAKFRHKNIGDKLHKLASILGLTSPEILYRQLVSHWTDPASLVLNAKEPTTALTGGLALPHLSNFVQKMMFLDLVSYLPDDILTKVDRASMGVSLESRIPLLDHRIVEFAWRLPLSTLRHQGEAKWPLRQVLYRYVPRPLMDRPKMGFGVPIDTWLRGPLKDWAYTLLAPDRLRQEGYFDADVVQRIWYEHTSGARNWQYLLWDVLMFQSWLEHYSNRVSSATPAKELSVGVN